MVRCSDAKTAKLVKPANPPEVIFLDPDGDEISRSRISNDSTSAAASDVERAMKDANAKYCKKEVSWATGDLKDVLVQAKEQRKLVAACFLDDKEDSKDLLDTLQDRWIAKHHDKFLFVKAPYEKGSEICKAWSVSSSASLLLINPMEEEAKKGVMERLGKKTVPGLRNSLLSTHSKFLKSLEK